jgi:hypothetical protein
MVVGGKTHASMLASDFYQALQLTFIGVEYPLTTAVQQVVFQGVGE